MARKIWLIALVVILTSAQTQELLPDPENPPLQVIPATSKCTTVFREHGTHKPRMNIGGVYCGKGAQ
jgi:hypothetical protein